MPPLDTFISLVLLMTMHCAISRAHKLSLSKEKSIARTESKLVLARAGIVCVCVCVHLCVSTRLSSPAIAAPAILFVSFPCLIYPLQWWRGALLSPMRGRPVARGTTEGVCTCCHHHHHHHCDHSDNKWILHGASAKTARLQLCCCRRPS